MKKLTLALVLGVLGVTILIGGALVLLRSPPVVEVPCPYPSSIFSCAYTQYGYNWPSIAGGLGLLAAGTIALSVAGVMGFVSPRIKGRWS